MAKGPIYRVMFRRRREGKTDYRKRLALLKSGKPRAIVRVSNKRITVQFVDYNPSGDRVIVNVTSDVLKKYGWDHAVKNMPAAYLTGYHAGKLALSKNIKEAVLDMGMQTNTPGNRIYSVLKGLLDAGVDIPHGEAVLPPEERVRGEHIGPDVPKKFEDVLKNLEA